MHICIVKRDHTGTPALQSNLTTALAALTFPVSQVRARSTDTIRLSRMVMNHSVAHVMLLEQLYRSQTILRNEPYHH